jgi:DNA polymerase
VSCDASQIECRVHAWTWGETELLEDFRLDRDPYSKLASEVFGVPVSKKENTHLRFVGKTAELSLSFGVGWKKFFHSITTSGQPDCDKFTKEDAIRTVEYYRNKRTGIVSGWKQLAPYMQMMAAKAIKGTMEFKNFRFQNERVYMPNDLAIQYKDFHWRYNKENKSGEYVYRFKDDWVYIYAAKMGQNNTQSIARSIVAEQAVHISKELPIVLLVHDEIVTLAPENEADDALQFMIDTMRKPPSWCSDLPLDAEGKHGKNYAK